MLGSILRYSIFIALVAAVTWGLYLVLETPGEIIVNVADQEIRLTPFAGLVGLLLAFLGLFILLKLAGFLLACARFIGGDDSALTRFFHMNREKKGFDALSRAITALASGDGRTAGKKAARAEELLERTDLTRLVAAQAAEMRGDKLLAKRYYKALAEQKPTAIAGVKGLLAIAQEEGDEDRALKLAKQASSLKPKDEQTLETLYALQSRHFDWQGARQTLSQQRRIGSLPKSEADRRDAMLALAQAEDAEELGQVEQAKALALEAAKIDPANPEAVATAARFLTQTGNGRAAQRLILKSWALVPSQQLAAAYAALEPEETAQERVQRFQKLFAVEGASTEARMIRAELALSTEDWKGARDAVAKIDEDEPSARTCAIMAAIARGEGEPDAVVRGWLAKALGAPRPEGQSSMLDHAAMLPLLVGEEHDPESDDAEIVPEDADTTESGETSKDGKHPADAAA